MNMSTDNYVEVLRSLADPTRLRLLNVLRGTSGICVCELVHALRLPQYCVSRHLRKLAGAGLLHVRRRGKWMYYRINTELRPYQRALLRAVALLGEDQADFSADLARAGQRLKLRRDGVCCVGLVARNRPPKRGEPGKLRAEKATKRERSYARA
jgi:ArsR family transcriptional regulator